MVEVIAGAGTHEENPKGTIVDKRGQPKLEHMLLVGSNAL